MNSDAESGGLCSCNPPVIRSTSDELLHTLIARQLVGRRKNYYRRVVRADPRMSFDEQLPMRISW